MNKSIAKIREREGNEKKSIPTIRERVSEAIILKNIREWEWKKKHNMTIKNI